ncbi:hypothetical protein EMIHUDRAFT_458278 [Emiliania huxleyi CCMP1516]|uniref:DNA (cytosine-5-)-methyltransferase n=2 Tax=Emiliania huxleyi TaxID=2903 RepID=A0A0D3JEE7_EMIH1|nr:hypothetical protein EMIHUDRAFT_458278 [Emiliania huxleyi CCMP1516]EOD21882.1 hypothetical protein EMIHUDRAFT_458278 [Emiliania huxleyi CCMP1516]|eukprot:XP_005774311.1 hypothetical protein EMIHUDRAFT_458278 [Emiliania huxleyi CCMP1516]
MADTTVDLDTLRAVFPKIFQSFEDTPAWLILGEYVSPAERNERRGFIEKRESVSEEKEAAARRRAMSEGQLSVEIAAQEPPYLSVTRDQLAASVAVDSHLSALSESAALELPLRQLHDFSLHDASGQLCRLEVLDERVGSKIYATGANWDSLDEQEREQLWACAPGSTRRSEDHEESDGVYVKGLGACSCYTISGYSQHDALVFPRPSVFLVTEAGQYELTTPSAQYAPFFAPVQEKVEVCKRLEYLVQHHKFILHQLVSFDAGATRSDAVAPRRRAAPAADLSTVRSAAAKTRWVGEGTREEGRVVHEAAEVDGKRISVGGWASLQPFAADHTSKDLQLVEVEALWAVGGAKMCRVRRLWRPAETFAGGVLDGALKEGVLIPDSCPQELPLHELKAPVDGAASGLHTGEWRYSPKWASYTKLAPPPSRKRSAAQSAAKRDQPASASGEALNVLELYSASGGLSFVEEAECAGGARLKTRWCCEWSKEEVETYRDNHPDCNVFHLDVEVFLRVCSKWAAMADGSFAPKKKGGKAAAAAKGAQEVVDVRGVDHRIEYLCRSPGGAERWVRDEEVADALVQAYVQANRGALPLPENVDVVMGGPPCQGVSGFNLYRHEDPLGDSKNRQTIHFTEMCLLQQPRFVIMENVVGILMFADSLVIKTSMRSFMQGGYQVRIGVCVSGTFGLPQNRARTILFAARGEEALPEYPAPTHQLPPVPISMMTTWMKKHLLNVPSAAESATLAKPLTLADAFSDLPSLKSPPARGFGSNKDNPNRAPKETKATPFRAATYGGKSSSGKPVQPLSDYQRAARERCTGKELHDHESFVLNEDDQERVSAVPKAAVKLHGCWRTRPRGPRARTRAAPLTAEARERRRDLPDDGLTSSGKPLVPEYARSYRRPNACFGRLAWSDIDRILSIRENARIQGFPDWYRFSGSIYSRYRQVGNAVSPKLAKALGGQILAAVEARAGSK